MNELRTCFGRVMLMGLWLTQFGAVSTCMALSCKRLMKHDKVDTQYMQQNEYRNIKRSLNIFYGLVLAQGTIFIIMQNSLIKCGLLKLRREYMLVTASGRDILYRYKNDNYMEFIMGNVRPTLNMDLVTFAKNLVLSSSIDDQLLGVRTIDNIFRSITAGDKPSREQQILARLQASLNPEALFTMLGLTINIDDEEDIRGHAARLLLQLAPLLPVESFSRIQHLICSLLSAENKDKRRDMDLVWFGLRILDKLTDNPENCREAKDCDDLLSKIIGLTNLCAHAHATTGGSCRNSESWMENEVLPLLLREEEIPTSFQQRIDEEIIAGMSLNVLGKLVAAPGEAGKELRRKTIESAHFHFHFHSTTRIISQIIRMLKNCLLSKTQHVNMTSKVAAKLLLLEYASSEQLREIQLLRNHILENPSSLPPMLVIIEELDLEYLDEPRWMNRIIQRLDLKDLLSATRVNSAEAAAQALVMLTTGSTSCQENIEAILQELDVEELKVIVNMLSLLCSRCKLKQGASGGVALPQCRCGPAAARGFLPAWNRPASVTASGHQPLTRLLPAMERRQSGSRSQLAGTGAAARRDCRGRTEANWRSSREERRRRRASSVASRSRGSRAAARSQKSQQKPRIYKDLVMPLRPVSALPLRGRWRTGPTAGCGGSSPSGPSLATSTHQADPTY